MARRTPRPPAPAPVTVTRPDPATLAYARRLAAGDLTRLRPNTDGSITVLNTGRRPDPFNPSPRR